MKIILTCLAVYCSLSLCADGQPHKTFTWSTELKYPFMPRQKMTFINGVVKNPGRKPVNEEIVAEILRLENNNPF